MSRIAPIAAVVFVSSAWGQARVSIEAQTQVTRTDDSTRESALDYQLTFEANSQGLTQMKVIGPQGARCEVWDEATLVREDSVPFTISVRGDRIYRFRVKLDGGRSWEKRLGARHQRTGLLSVNVDFITPPPPTELPPGQAETPAPRTTPGMPEADFARLQEAIETESLPQQKWAVLQTAVSGGARFTVGQVGQLVGLFDASSQKVSVVEVARTRIVDRKNLFLLYSFFDSDAEKQRVRSILGQ
jgi:hypothetical protein